MHSLTLFLSVSLIHTHTHVFAVINSFFSYNQTVFSQLLNKPSLCGTKLLSVSWLRSSMGDLIGLSSPSRPVHLSHNIHGVAMFSADSTQRNTVCLRLPHEDRSCG